LACITPCAGFVPLWASPIIGTLAGIVCYLAVQLKNKMKWDDALDVWGVHGVGGVLGTILLGVFGSKAINAAGADGLWFGNTSFFVKELVAVTIASVYAFIFTYLMLAIINKITPVRVSEEEEMAGLDSSIHGEQAYDEGAL
jgi:Amt family ammonium transporter